MTSEAVSSVKQVAPPPEPSEHFWDVFGSGIGSPSLVCSCGRRHYAPDGQYVGETESAEMQQDWLDHPAQVVMHTSCDAVSAKVINGMTLVVDCPCGWMGRFEQLIWRERTRILRYYRARRDAEAAKTTALDAELAAAEGAKP